MMATAMKKNSKKNCQSRKIPTKKFSWIILKAIKSFRIRCCMHSLPRKIQTHPIMRSLENISKMRIKTWKGWPYQAWREALLILGRIIFAKPSCPGIDGDLSRWDMGHTNKSPAKDERAYLHRRNTGPPKWTCRQHLFRTRDIFYKKNQWICE